MSAVLEQVSQCLQHMEADIAVSFLLLLNILCPLEDSYSINNIYKVSSKHRQSYSTVN